MGLTPQQRDRMVEARQLFQSQIAAIHAERQQIVALLQVRVFLLSLKSSNG